MWFELIRSPSIHPISQKFINDLNANNLASILIYYDESDKFENNRINKNSISQITSFRIVPNRIIFRTLPTLIIPTFHI